ncbi:MAG TPA: NUDIX hydrolase [Casimicrobiaceae bacterium]|nr:NUDIX hydrolase [Casimicrobiaceae bacterium]
MSPTDDDDERRPPPRVPRDAEHLVETRIASTHVFDGALLHVRRDRVRLPDGRESIREYVVHPGAALVVPRLADGRVVVVRQFRYPVNAVFIEFPAGKLDPGESALDTAQRELREEAGYTASHWTSLGVIHPVVAYSTEAIALFLAEDLVHVGARLDEGEFLDVHIVDLATLEADVDAGLLTDGKMIAALHFLARHDL